MLYTYIQHTTCANATHALYLLAPPPHARTCVRIRQRMYVYNATHAIYLLAPPPHARTCVRAHSLSHLQAYVSIRQHTSGDKVCCTRSDAEQAAGANIPIRNTLLTAVIRNTFVTQSCGTQVVAASKRTGMRTHTAVVRNACVMQ
jgi:hypothetical protein